MGNYRNSTTYRHKLTKDNKQDTNETNNKYTETSKIKQYAKKRKYRKALEQIPKPGRNRDS
jgi:hypothetical protein